jgi:hypothetical protein
VRPLGGEGAGGVVEAGPRVEAALLGEGAAAAVTGAVVDVLGEELPDPGRVVRDERDDQGKRVVHLGLRTARSCPRWIRTRQGRSIETLRV